MASTTVKDYLAKVWSWFLSLKWWGKALVIVGLLALPNILGLIGEGGTAEFAGIEPKDGFSTTSSGITIKGHVSNLGEGELLINGDVINVGTDGAFQHAVSLQEGKNTFELIGKKKFSAYTQKVSITRNPTAEEVTTREEEANKKKAEDEANAAEAAKAARAEEKEIVKAYLDETQAILKLPDELVTKAAATAQGGNAVKAYAEFKSTKEALEAAQAQFFRLKLPAVKDSEGKKELEKFRTEVSMFFSSQKRFLENAMLAIDENKPSAFSAAQDHGKDALGSKLRAGLHMAELEKLYDIKR